MAWRMGGVIRPTLDPSTTAWVNAVIANGGTVSQARQIVVNNLIVSLKGNGVWSILDRLWLLAAENTQSALTDLVGLTLATVTGTPTFTANTGYTGDDVNTNVADFIDTGYSPSGNGVNLQQNSAHMSAWCVGNLAATNGGCLAGSAQNAGNQIDIFDTFTDGNVYARNNGGSTGSLGAPSTRAGHWISDRTTSTLTVAYQNGSSFNSVADTSGSPSNISIFILGLHDPFNSPTTGCSRGTPNQIAMLSAGGGLGATNASNFYTPLRTYMTAVGVP